MHLFRDFTILFVNWELRDPEWPWTVAYFCLITTVEVRLTHDATQNVSFQCQRLFWSWMRKADSKRPTRQLLQVELLWSTCVHIEFCWICTRSAEGGLGRRFTAHQDGGQRTAKLPAQLYAGRRWIFNQSRVHGTPVARNTVPSRRSDKVQLITESKSTSAALGRRPINVRWILGKERMSNVSQLNTCAVALKKPNHKAVRRTEVQYNCNRRKNSCIAVVL